MHDDLEGPGWRCVWPAACALGEGPIWDADAGALWFVDIERAAIHRFVAASGERFSWTAPCRVGAVGLRAGGGMIAATEHGFALVDPLAGTCEMLGHPEEHLPANRFNDGKVDAAGRFWAGTMDERDHRRQGSLYRFGPGHGWTLVDGGYHITNGPAFSCDGGTLYANDSLDRITYAFDLAEDGTVSRKRVFVAWPEGSGAPDGMTVDADDHLWIAFWGGWCVRRVAPGGAVVAEFAVPAAHVTSCAFGGAGLDRLFVTCAREGLDAAALDAQPLAGGLFELAPGVRGLPGGVYAG